MVGQKVLVVLFGDLDVFNISTVHIIYANQENSKVVNLYHKSLFTRCCRTERDFFHAVYKYNK